MEFSKNPFIIDDDLSLAIVDARIPKSMEEELNKRNIQIIKTTECKNTYEAIKYHPDIQVFNLGNKNIVASEDTYHYYKQKLEGLGFNVIKGYKPILKKYPNNVMYNVAVLGKFAIHNFNYTDNNILKYIDDNNLIKVHVNQGYSKCSICIVDNNSIITSDMSIHKECINNDIDSLLISEGEIDLFNMNYGFIGGCSGLISKDEIAFCGDIRKHSNYKQIKEFIERRGKSIITLSQDKLLDLGSIIPLKVRKER